MVILLKRNYILIEEIISDYVKRPETNIRFLVFKIYFSLIVFKFNRFENTARFRLQ